MEIRTIYQQGKSSVIVVPTKYMKALNWRNGDKVTFTLLPMRTLKVSKIEDLEQIPLIV